MAVYQLRTYNDIVEAVREELQGQSTDTTLVNRIKRDLNIIYAEVLAENTSWWWLQKHSTLQLPAYFNTGSASVTQGSSVVTLTTAPTSSKEGFLFTIDGFSEIYKIDSHAANSTTLYLSENYAGTTGAALAFHIWTDRIPLPTDCKEVSNVWHDHMRAGLQRTGISEFRRITTQNARVDGFPSYYSVSDFVDPSQATTISGLPALSTRASAGAVKTLVFASALPTSITDKVEDGEPVRLKINGAGQPSYNGEVMVTSISTTTVTNDTLTYTGKGLLTEAATADSGLSVKLLGSETDYGRYRELMLFPSINAANVTLNVDYVKDVLPLENDDDEPVMPVEDRVVLLYGALSRAWKRARNESEAANNLGLYKEKLAKMAGKIKGTFDTPRLAPSKLYLGAKRSVSRGRVSSDANGSLYDSWGGLSGAVVQGNPNTVAAFDSNGNISSLPTISTTEAGYLDGVTSNIQTQLTANASAITTLDGEVDTHVADATAHPVPSTLGSAQQTLKVNAGGTALEYATLAGTSNQLTVTYGPGTITLSTPQNTHTGASPTFAGMTLTAFSGTLKATAGVLSAGAIVNADIDASAAIAWSKLDKTGSNLTDIATRSHTSLTDIGTTTHANLDVHVASTALHVVKFQEDVAMTGLDVTKNVDVSAVTDARTMIWQLCDNSNNYERLGVTLTTPDADTVTISTEIPLTAGSYRLIGIG